MRFRALLGLALIIAAPCLALADEVGGPIPVWVRSNVGRGQAGQGVVVQGRDACVVVTAKHVVAESSEVVVRTDQGEHTAIVAYQDPDLDFAILQVNPPIHDCAPIASSGRIDGALRKGIGLIWNRAETGAQLTRGVSLSMFDDRIVQLTAIESLKSVQRGMSGAPVAFDGVAVAVVLSSDETGGHAFASTLRLDYIARLAGKRLQTPQVVSPAEPQAENAAATPQQSASAARLADGLFIWPLKSREMISGFGIIDDQTRNDGVNISATAGSPVVAVADGLIVYAGEAVAGFGKLILIRHADGWVSAYAHLSRSDVKLRQTVTQGQTIGAVGQTGGVSSPQLHFELRYAATPAATAKAIDPLLALPPIDDAVRPEQAQSGHFFKAPIDDDRRVIVIDPGHGGKDPGTVGAQTQEKDIALAAALQLKAELLRRYPAYAVLLTRADDEYVDLPERIRLAASAQADLVISLHADSGAESATRGTLVYRANQARLRQSDPRYSAVEALYGAPAVYGGERATRLAATLVTRLKARGVPMAGGEPRDGAFVLLNYPLGAALLVQMGFLTNSEDEIRLSSDVGRQPVIAALADAVDGYFRP